MTLDEITQKINKCTLCPLHSGRTKTVPGEGSKTAKIMFVGEGPGKNEDEKGIPFCGASGKFLDELLSSINLSRKDVFITNVVKCRPPENRDPTFEEINTCTTHYLFNQISLINPKVVAFLGRHSMGVFMKDMKISQVHGKAFKRKDKIFIPLYHPAVGLYNGGMRKSILEDFQIIKDAAQVNFKNFSGEFAQNGNIIIYAAECVNEKSNSKNVLDQPSQIDDKNKRDEHKFEQVPLF